MITQVSIVEDTLAQFLVDRLLVSVISSWFGLHVPVCLGFEAVEGPERVVKCEVSFFILFKRH